MNRRDFLKMLGVGSALVIPSTKFIFDMGKNAGKYQILPDDQYGWFYAAGAISAYSIAQVVGSNVYTAHSGFQLFDEPTPVAVLLHDAQLGEAIKESSLYRGPGMHNALVTS